MDVWYVDYIKPKATRAHHYVTPESLEQFKSEFARHRMSGSEDILRVIPPTMCPLSEIYELRSLGFRAT